MITAPLPLTDIEESRGVVAGVIVRWGAATVVCLSVADGWTAVGIHTPEPERAGTPESALIQALHRALDAVDRRAVRMATTLLARTA